MSRKSLPRNVSEETVGGGELVTDEEERDFESSGALLGLKTLDPNTSLSLLLRLIAKT